MENFELGNRVTINGVSLDGEICCVSQRLYSVPQYEVRRYTHPEGKLVSDWYYAEELTLRPAEAEVAPGEEDN